MTDEAILRATIYADEVQLLSWSENDKGRKVTLMLSPHAGEQHPFRDYKPGKRFMLAATVIGDDETPEPAKSASRTRAAANPGSLDTPSPSSEASKGVRQSTTPEEGIRRSSRTRGEMARRLCAIPEFQDWIGSARDFDDAKRTLKIRLGLHSTTELDEPEKTGFHEAWDRLKTSFDYRDRA